MKMKTRIGLETDSIDRKAEKIAQAWNQRTNKSENGENDRGIGSKLDRHCSDKLWKLNTTRQLSRINESRKDRLKSETTRVGTA